MTILLSWPPQTKFALYVISISPQTECPSLIIPVYLSIHPPYLLLRSMFFPPCSLPVKGSFDVPLDLWLTLFNPVYNKQKALGLKVCARAESHHNQKQVLSVSHMILDLGVHSVTRYLWHLNVGPLAAPSPFDLPSSVAGHQVNFRVPGAGEECTKGGGVARKGYDWLFSCSCPVCMHGNSEQPMGVTEEPLQSSPLLIRVCSFTLTPWLVPHYVAGQV